MWWHLCLYGLAGFVVSVWHGKDVLEISYLLPQSLPQEVL